MHILYTTSDEFEGVVFAEKTRAEAIARVHDALRTATTWGDFKEKLTVDEFSEILQVKELDEEEVDLDKRFRADSIPGYADGDYPTWLVAEMLDWFPKDLIVKYSGETAASTLNGDFLILPEDRAEEIAADLAARGHEVARSELFFH